MKILKSERRWCVRTIRKVPYSSFNEPGDMRNPQTWISFQEANELWKSHPVKFNGLGFYLGMINLEERRCLCGIDIDAIKNNNNTHNPLANSILDRFRGTYAEKSPSGGGYHIICYVDLDYFPYEVNNYPYSFNIRDIGLEVYIGKFTNRYLTYTGDILPGFQDEITDQTENVQWLLNHYMLKPENKRSIAIRQRTTLGAVSRPHLNHHADFDLKRRLGKIKYADGEKFKKLYIDGDTENYPSPSEADFALLCLMVPWLEGDEEKLDEAFRGSALYQKNGRSAKWDEKRGQLTYGQMSIQNAIRAVTLPYYSESPDYAKGDSIKPEDIVRYIDEEQKAGGDKITVLPFACGTGKSSAISYKIAEVLQDGGTDGMIILTDRIERMYEYPAPKNEGLAELKEYIGKHKSEICVLEGSTINEVRDIIPQFRILIMTTQRFFEWLTVDEIKGYTHWKKGERSLILIDETPILQELHTVTLDSVNLVKRIFSERISGRANRDEQDWCRAQWKKIIDKLDDYVYRCNDGSKNKFFFFKGSAGQATEDDVRFMKFVSVNQGAFIRKNTESINAIRAAVNFLTQWGITDTSEQKKSTSKTKLYTLIDNKYKLFAAGVKTIILDGTAELSCDYYDERFDVKVIPECRRRLDRLSIHPVNRASTKETIKSYDRKGQQKLAENIRNFVWNQEKDGRKVVFTYKDGDGLYLESELKKKFNYNPEDDNVDHFGDIRGKNVYGDANTIVQFGLNQFPKPCYMLYYLNNNPDQLQRLKESEDETWASNMLAELENNTEINRLRYMLILNDIEQNFFRGVIRNSGSEKREHYYVFFKLSMYQDMIRLMRLRYWPLGGRIREIKKPVEFIKQRTNNRTDGRKTNVQILTEWLQTCRFMRVFSYSDITKETGLTTQQISKIRANRSEIKKIFESWNIGDGNYRKTTELT